MSTEKQPEEGLVASTLAAIKNVTTRVAKMVTDFVSKGVLHLPRDYSPENALKEAWLILQVTVDKDKKPVLETCTEASIMNALLDMVIQGLSPHKKQCYFIAYGKQLVCQRSYFGDEALARRLMPGLELYHGVVYEGDVFEYQIQRGKLIVTTHQQKLENINTAKIKAIYSGIEVNGHDQGVEVMTMAQIQKSWAMSKVYVEGGTHQQFPDQMGIRTVNRRRLKPIINASDDSLLLEAVRRQDVDSFDAEFEDRVAEEANQATIAVEALPQTTGTPVDVSAEIHAARNGKEPVGAAVGGAVEEEAGY